MSSVVISGNTSGAITVEAPDIAGTNTITLPAASGIVALTNTQIGMKNRIINGAMMIDQRNAGASVTPSNQSYTLDRYISVLSQTSKFSIQQNAGSVTPPAGFQNYLGVTSLSAYSVGSGEIFAIEQRIEGFNTADLNWGTANAQTVTLSFWVRSSLTGTFGGTLNNASYNRFYPFSYTISSANTWEYKTITIAGDTTGTWATNNTTGILLRFSLGSGSSVSGTAGSWTGSTFYSTTGATSVVGTNGATWYITGVQLEVGSTATSFDYRAYGTELALCQRYFARMVSSNTFTALGSGMYVSATLASVYVKYPLTMRTSPTLDQGNLAINDTTGNIGVTGITTSYIGPESAYLALTVASGGTQTRPVLLVTNTTAGFLSMSAEL